MNSCVKQKYKNYHKKSFVRFHQCEKKTRKKKKSTVQFCEKNEGLNLKYSGRILKK